MDVDPDDAQAERDARIKREEDQRTEDFRKLLSMPEGMRVFKWMIRKGNLFGNTFTGNSQGFYNEGWKAFAGKVVWDEIIKADMGKILEIVGFYYKGGSDERNSNRNADRQG